MSGNPRAVFRLASPLRGSTLMNEQEASEREWQVINPRVGSASGVSQNKMDSFDSITYFHCITLRLFSCSIG